MTKMDLREAKVCLDEYRALLDSIRSMLEARTGEGEHRDATEKRNTSRIAAWLEASRKEALILSNRIVLEMYVRDDEEIFDFSDEWKEINVAQNKLWVAIDKAEQAREEYLNPDEAKKRKRDPNSPRVVIQKV
jgi:hypothetical protein